MPRISEFYGILIYMYFNDHDPPHFHAKYGEFEALISIDSVEVIRGTLPRRALKMVFEWTQLHRTELRENWANAREGNALNKIDPLD